MKENSQIISPIIDEHSIGVVQRNLGAKYGLSQLCVLNLVNCVNLSKPKYPSSVPKFNIK